MAGPPQYSSINLFAQPSRSLTVRLGQSIQAKLDEAVQLGAAAPSSPVSVILEPGVYVEDLVMPNGVILRGSESIADLTTIVGSIVAPGAPVAPPDFAAFAISGISIDATSGPNIALDVQGDTVAILLDGARLASNVSAFRWGASLPSFFSLSRTTFTGGSGSDPTIDIASPSANTNIEGNQLIARNVAGGDAIRHNGGSLTAAACQFEGRVGLQAGASGQFRFCSVETFALEAVLLDGFLNAQNCALKSDAGSGNVVDGAGTLIGSVVALPGTAKQVAGTLTAFIDQGQIYAPDPANWGGTPPNNLAEAVSRIAAAVGPVP